MEKGGYRPTSGHSLHVRERQRFGRRTSRLGIVKADVDALGHSYGLNFHFCINEKLLRRGHDHF